MEDHRIQLPPGSIFYSQSRSLTASSIRAAQTYLVGPNGKHTDGRGSSLPQAEAARLPPPCKKVEVVWRAGILHC
jgi:hypothetical protein